MRKLGKYCGKYPSTIRSLMCRYVLKITPMEFARGPLGWGGPRVSLLEFYRQTSVLIIEKKTRHQK